MTRDDIVRMMQAAGAGKDDKHPTSYSGFIDTFERFAVLVAAAEREACIQDCISAADSVYGKGTYNCEDFNACINAIRARK